MITGQPVVCGRVISHAAQHTEHARCCPLNMPLEFCRLQWKTATLHVQSSMLQLVLDLVAQKNNMHDLEASASASLSAECSSSQLLSLQKQAQYQLHAISFGKQMD